MIQSTWFDILVTHIKKPLTCREFGNAEIKQQGTTRPLKYFALKKKYSFYFPSNTALGSICDIFIYGHFKLLLSLPENINRNSHSTFSL